MAELETHWKINATTSCLHVAECLMENRPLANEQLVAAMTENAIRISELIAMSGVSDAVFLSHLLPLSAQIDSNRQLATVVLTKTFGPQRGEGVIKHLANLLGDLQTGFESAVPSLAGQLSADAAPLRQSWDSHGNELLSAVARLTEPQVVVPEASVILLYPAAGGGGRAYLLYNSVGIEVLADDPLTELPEVLRLCWLISQLNADLPMFQGEIHRDRLFEIAALAMIPVVVSAAAESGLATADEATFRLAVTTWMSRFADAESTADVLWRWWETYTSGKPSWSVALAALDQLLETP